MDVSVAQQHYSALSDARLARRQMGIAERWERGLREMS